MNMLRYDLARAAAGQGIDAGPAGAYDPAMRKVRAAAFLLCVVLAVTAATNGTTPPPIEIIPASGTYVVTIDHVNVRASPDVQAGKVIGQLNKGAVVDVLEMTKRAFEVNGNISAWFHLKSPDGWVFGWYLDPRE
jgi:hypothetical protein